MGLHPAASFAADTAYAPLRWGLGITKRDDSLPPDNPRGAKELGSSAEPVGRNGPADAGTERGRQDLCAKLARQRLETLSFRLWVSAKG